MATKVDFYNNNYGNFESDLLAEIRRETYGENLGQSSWLTADEYDKFCGWLNIDSSKRVLEVASGSGGPALYMAEKYSCRVTGIDINREGINTATQTAASRGITNADFQCANVDERLPFENDYFDAIISIDAANHFPDRAHVLREWYRILKPAGRILFTDPVVITGPISNEEIAARSNIGFFIFIPPDVTEQFINNAGFRLLKREDVTENIVLTSGRWHDARDRRREAVIKIEGEERFNGLQLFLSTVHKLTSELRLSRFAFLAEK
jgi:SAM-dependent methyltransferase